jgi:hypothetical protein
MTDKSEPTFYEACAALEVAVNNLQETLMQLLIEFLQDNFLDIALFLNIYLTICIFLYSLGYNLP